MTMRSLTSSFQFAVLPFLPLQKYAESHGVDHPLAALILLVILFAGIAWTFRRRSS